MGSAAAHALLLLAVLALGAGTAHAQVDAIRTEAEVQPAPPAAPAPKARRARAGQVLAIVLDPLPTELAQKRLAPADKPGTPHQVGVGRAVPALAAADDAMAHLHWERTPEGGFLAAVSFTSPGALALRVGLQVAALPEGTALRFYGATDGVVHETNAALLRAAIARNLAAGEDGPEARTWWSPIVEDATLVMEIELPPGAQPRDVRLAAPQLSHLLASAANGFFVPKAAAACELDVMCYPGEWDVERSAVARIVYTRDGGSFVCSGTLLADKDTGTFVPYFLTANHCIATQAQASSIQSYWFYRSTTCNSGVRGPYRTLAGGATLLYASGATDTAFVRFNGTPPAGAGYAGWIVGAAPPNGAAVTGIHHPTGDLQKISFGAISGYWRCEPSGDGRFSCSGSSASASSYYGVRWIRGITEPGSSGSPIFLDNGRYLVGQLYGGTTSCESESSDYYGRFDVAYHAALRQWLGGSSSTTPPTTPVILPTRDYSDLWWNPAESGWGIAITQHASGMVFASWYVYDSAGRPLWVVMPGGRWTTPTTFTGDLYTTTGPWGLGPFDPARVTNNRVGIANLSFSGSDVGTLSYTALGISETRTIRRQLFGIAGTSAPGTYRDMWWNPAESGWGVSISQQHGALFVVWYTYRADGLPVWYVMPDGRWSGATWSGTLYRTTYGAPPYFGRSFNAAAVQPIPVGSLSLSFAGSNSATMHYSVDGVTGTKSLQRQAF